MPNTLYLLDAMALAYRAADKLADDLKKGNL